LYYQLQRYVFFDLQAPSDLFFEFSNEMPPRFNIDTTSCLKGHIHYNKDCLREAQTAISASLRLSLTNQDDETFFSDPHGFHNKKGVPELTDTPENYQQTITL